MKKIVILSTSDIRGGAARAAYRLHKGLQSTGTDSQMVVQTKYSNDSTVIGPHTKFQKGLSIIKLILDSLPLQAYPKRNNVMFSPAILPNNIARKITNLNPDIINLHWVSHGFLRIETLRALNKPLVWTLHDMWPFTGGCHYDNDCGRYRESCGACPLLGSSRKNDLSHKIWMRKQKAWQDLNFTIVTPSRWLAQCVRDSSLFSDYRIEVIPNGLELNRYKTMDKHLTRELLSLPQDKKLILFGAMSSISDRRKGFQFLQPALQKLAADSGAEKAELIVFGALSQYQNVLNYLGLGWNKKAKPFVFGASKPANLLNLSLKAHNLGHLQDNSLALLYAAADVFIAPSIQENLSNTVMEALACGTPCVAFNIGGMSDMIEHKHTGYLAKPFDIEDLANGIAWVLEDEKRWQALSHQARKKVEDEFAIESVAQRYVKLYQEILEQ